MHLQITPLQPLVFRLSLSLFVFCRVRFIVHQTLQIFPKPLNMCPTGLLAGLNISGTVSRFIYPANSLPRLLARASVKVQQRKLKAKPLRICKAQPGPGSVAMFPDWKHMKCKRQRLCHPCDAPRRCRTWARTKECYNRSYIPRVSMPPTNMSALLHVGSTLHTNYLTLHLDTAPSNDLCKW